MASCAPIADRRSVGGYSRCRETHYCRRRATGESAMTEGEKEKAKAAAVAGVGAGVGTAGGATVGVLELAARGAATGPSAGLGLGVRRAAGAGIAYGLYRLFK